MWGILSLSFNLVYFAPLTKSEFKTTSFIYKCIGMGEYDTLPVKQDFDER